MNSVRPINYPRTIEHNYGLCDQAYLSVEILIYSNKAQRVNLCIYVLRLLIKTFKAQKECLCVSNLRGISNIAAVHTMFTLSQSQARLHAFKKADI